MKTYKIAINSIAFTLSLLLGIGTVYMIVQPVPISSPENQARNMNSMGQVKKMNSDSFLLEYSFEGEKWTISIDTNDSTKFKDSDLLIEDNVVYGRTFVPIGREDIKVGTRVLVDWLAVSGEGYVATDVTKMDQYAVVNFSK